MSSFFRPLDSRKAIFRSVEASLIDSSSRKREACSSRVGLDDSDLSSWAVGEGGCSGEDSGGFFCQSGIEALLVSEGSLMTVDSPSKTCVPERLSEMEE